jgi:hypothetical protein
VTLYELKLFFVHLVPNAPEVHADLAAVLFIASQQLGEEHRPPARKSDAVFLALVCPCFDDVIWLKCLDEAVDHRLSRYRLLVFLLVSVGDVLEKGNDEVETAPPQGRVHLEHALQGFPVPRLDEKREAKRSASDLGGFHKQLQTCPSF